MKEFEKICKSCMTEIGDKKICPKCGYNQEEMQPAPYLPIGTLLEDRYAVGKGILKTPEGLSYVAFDIVNKTPVYIHEYFPSDFCIRAEGEKEVIVIAGFEKQFDEFRDNFLKYYRSLARLRAFTGLIPIFNIFSQNNTSYVVSEWTEGITLTEFVKKNGGYMSWESIRPLFMPLVSSLSQIHSSGISHLAICPDNLIITNTGKMKLVGFAIPDIRKVNDKISTELNDGCSALEQYIEGSKMDETTDVYGFAASIFYALTGSYPKRAVKRQEDDRLFISTTLLKQIPTFVVSALANALQVYPSRRTSSFERFRAEISAAPTVINKIDSEQSDDEIEVPGTKKGMSNFMISVISCSVALAIFLIIGAFCFLGNSLNMNTKTVVSSSNVESSYSTISADEVLENKVTVPNLVGKNYKEVHDNISNTEDYTISLLSEEFSDTVKEGYIASQSPAAGDRMASGSVIMVTVSKGSKTRTLPDVSLLTLSEASLKLASSGFKPVQVQENSNTVESGYVIGYKNNNPGDKLDYGSEVTIVVSLGKG